MNEVLKAVVEWFLSDEHVFVGVNIIPTFDRNSSPFFVELVYFPLSAQLSLREIEQWSLGSRLAPLLLRQADELEKYVNRFKKNPKATTGKIAELSERIGLLKGALNVITS